MLAIRRPRLGNRARLARAATIWDLRAIGDRRTPTAVFDYVDGGAEAEITLVRSRDDFRRVEFHPAVLNDVSEVDMSTTVLGAPSSMPFGLAPTGFTRMMHHEGEKAVARAASAAGLVYCLSTLGTTSAPAVAKAAPDGNLWFQLYLPKDRGLGLELIAAAYDSGFSAMVLTMDTAVPGIRLRDVRNGLTFPPALSLRALAGMAAHPRWWFEALTREPLGFASFKEQSGSVPELLSQLWDPTLSSRDVEWVRSQWNRPLVLKGIQRLEDARAAFDLGADGIVLSNHGGRQLDRAVTSLGLLRPVVMELGDRGEVYMDGGITSGADVVAAIALGARHCFVGRAYLYGLMAGGEAGVERAITILGDEIRRTMQLLGAKRISDLAPHLVSTRAASD